MFVGCVIFIVRGGEGLDIVSSVVDVDVVVE